MISCTNLRIGISQPLESFSRVPDPRVNVLWAQSGRPPMSRTQALIKIESFVDLVISAQEPAYTFRQDKSGAWIATETRTGKGLTDVLPLLGLFDSGHDYSEKPYAFLEACWFYEDFSCRDLNLIGANPAWGRLYWPQEINWIADRIRQSARQDWFLRGVSDRKYESKWRAARIADYVATLLHRYSRLVLVRVDLFYRDAVRLNLSIDRLYRDLEQLLMQKDRHGYFQHLKGYVWAIEEGVRKGPHAHMLFIFDGAEIRDDVAMAQMIRRQWDGPITGGEGKSWSSNLNKLQFEEVGIGTIERTDRDACERAVRFATYLAKDPHRPEEDDPQYLRMKPAGARTFGVGQIEEESSSRGGRPLVNPVTWDVSDMQGIRWPCPSRK